MADYWIRVDASQFEGFPPAVDYGLIDDNNPAPEGTEIIQLAEGQTIDDAISEGGYLDFEEDINLHNIEYDFEYKIWDLSVKPSLPDADPRGLDYKTGLISRLHEKSLDRNKGVDVRNDFYESFDGEIYSNLIVREEFVWTFDDNGKFQKREMKHLFTIKGSTDDQPIFGEHVKETEKYYTDKDAAKAGRARRDNVISDMLDAVEKTAIALGNDNLLGYVQTMFRSFDNELNAYKTTGDTRIIEKIAAYNVAWIEAEVLPGATLRQAIMAQLSLTM